MDPNDVGNNIEWYSRHRDIYLALSEKMADMLEEVLKHHGINYVRIEKHCKSLESYRAKLEREVGYDPREMQDLAGVRIIAFVRSDIDRIRKVLQDDLDIVRSQDRTSDPGADRAGYHSELMVAQLPKERTRLIEYRKFDGLQFEVQVRTLLEHAWAEIQHDRNYKYAGVLPEFTQRRFALLSAVLEMADNEFDAMSRELDEYSAKVLENAKKGELDILIDSTSIKEFMKEEFGSEAAVKQDFGSAENMVKIVRELNALGIYTLSDLKKHIPDQNDYVFDKNMNLNYLIYAILISSFKEEFFDKAWNPGIFSGMDASFVRYLKKKGFDNIEEVLQRKDIAVLNRSKKGPLVIKKRVASRAAPPAAQKAPAGT